MRHLETVSKKKMKFLAIEEFFLLTYFLIGVVCWAGLSRLIRGIQKTSNVSFPSNMQFFKIFHIIFLAERWRLIADRFFIHPSE